MILTQLNRLRQAQIPVGDTDSFISTWETTGASELVTIPLRTTATYDITVNWGDGEADTTYSAVGSLTALNHTYTTIGAYDITISSNTADGWKGVWFQNVGDKTKIKDIKQWGTSATVFVNFYGCTGLTVLTATDTPVLTGLNSLQNSFRGCTNLSLIPNIENWDISNITDSQGLRSLFRDCTSLNPNVSSWDVSGVTRLDEIFLNCQLFDQDLSGWNMVGKINVTLFNGFGNSWSATNYDATLIGWAAQAVTSGLNFGAGDADSRRTTASDAAYTTLTTTYTWTFTAS
jgi:surface protein